MATQVQAAVVGALETLQFENQGSSRPGAPVRLKVTPAALDYLTLLKNQTVEVDSQGALTLTPSS